MKQKNTQSWHCPFLLSIVLLLSLSGNLQAQKTTGKISGIIVDSLSQFALPGVNVIVEGSNRGTSSDDSGRFRIEAAPTDVLVISYTGYVPKKITVGEQSTINIALSTDVQALEQVVVTGYSAQRKKDITGSVSVVDMDALKSVPAGSAVKALQGQAAGVNVISSGYPGGSNTVFIRGISSFGDASPLVLVDGVETNLNQINANDIESIQVLKDAGAASIYGVRGSNGVIIVTTKKGKAGDPVVSYNAYAGVELPLPGNPFDIIKDPEAFGKLALTADPGNPLFMNGLPDFMYAGPDGAGVAWAGDPAVDPTNYHFDPNNPGSNYLIQEVNKQGTDWFHELFKPAFTTNHNLSVSGGTEKSSYMVSLDYTDQQGTLIETYLKRYSGRVNTSFKLGKHIELGQNLTVYYVNQPGFSLHNQFGGIAEIYKMMPLVPTRDIMGNYGGTRAGINLGSNSNTVANQERSAINNNNSWNAAGNVFLEVSFLKDFKARTSIGGGLTNTYNYGFSHTQYENVQGYLSPNSFSENSSFTRKIMWTNTLSYSKTLDKHQISAIIGSESIENLGRGLSGSRREYYSTDPDYLTLNTGTSNIVNGSTAYENALFSLFSRVDYSYDNKYLLGLTVRRDGSSLFGPENRYGTFPSFSLGWRISNEHFMQDLSWVSELKVRGSYGILGSQNNVNPENQFDLYGGGLSDAYYDIRGTSNSLVQGFIQTQSGNPYTGWERNIVSNIGLDASLFNNQIYFSVDYYKKSIDGLLFAQTLPALAGGANPATVNIGDIQNSGLDISATYNGGQGKSLQYSLGANITAYKNLVKSVPDPGYFDAASHQQLGTIVRNQVDEAVSSFYGYQVTGLFQSEAEVAGAPTQDGAAPGRFRYEDLNGDGNINAEDRMFLGSPNPDFTYGINISGQYKGFDLSAVFYGSQGNEAVNTVPVYTHFFGTYVGAKSNALFNAWTPENRNTTVPKIENQNSFSTAGVFNSYFVEDASFLKMKSLIVGYTISQGGFTEKLSIGKLRVYLQATNLFTITSYQGLDPEITGSSAAFGVDLANYPNNQQSFLLGLNLTF